MRRVLPLLAAVPLLLALVLAAAVVLLHLPPGQRWAGDRLGEALGIEIEGFQLDWPFIASAREVRVADPGGTWLRILRPHLDWDPADLLAGTLRVERLAAERIVVARLPAAGPSHGPAFTGLPLAVRLEAVALPVELGAEVLGRPVALDVLGTASAVGDGGKVDLALKAAGVGEARVNGTAGRDFLDLRWHAEADRLAGFDRLVADGVVVGRLPHPVLTAAAETRQGRVGGLSWRAAALSLQAIPDGPLWRLAATGSLQAPAIAGKALPDARLTAAGEVDTAQGLVLLGDGRLTGGGLTVAARGIGEQWGRRSTVWLSADLPELAALPGGLHGHAHASGVLAGDLQAPQLDGMVAVRGSGVSTGVAQLDRILGASPRGQLRLALTAGGTVAIGAARLDGAKGRVWAAGTPRRLWGVAEVREVSAGGLPPASGTGWFSTDGGSVAAVVEVAAEGLRVAGPLELTAQGLSGRLEGEFAHRLGTLRAVADLAPEAIRLRLAGEGLGGTGEAEGIVFPARDRARIDRLSIEAGEQQARLAGPAEVAWGGRGIRLGAATLRVGAGSVRLAGGLVDGRLAGEATLQGVPLGLVALAVPDFREPGQVNGTVRLAGTPGDPEVFANLYGRRLGGGSLTASLVGRWRGGVASGVLNARDGERLALRAEGERRPDDAIAGRVEMRGDLGRLTELVPGLAGHVFTGALKGQAELSGTTARPLVAGTVTLRNGRYENLDQGTIVADAQGTLAFDGDQVRLEVAGSDGGQGRLRLNGSGGVEAYRLQAGLADFRLVRRDDAQATASGRLRVDGGGTAARLTGRLAVDPAEIDIGRLRGAGPVALDVEEVNRRRPPAATPEAGGEAPVEVALDLAVEVRRAFVRGSGLESEWRGTLAVAGTAAEPLLTGRLTAERGDYQLVGRDFRLTPDSAVSFTGGDPAEAQLAVTGEAKAKDITARVLVTGPLNSPEVDFASDPPLPRDEVLARVLFGRGTGGLSAAQQIELGRLAAGQLTGGDEGGLDPIGAVRGALGLDVLGFGTEEGSGAPTVSAGKYLGRDTFVRVEQGTTGLGKVVVEQELGMGFSVETSMGQQAGSGVGVSWRRDY